MRHFSQRSLSTQVAISVGVVTIAVMAVLISLVSWRTQQAAISSVQREMAAAMVIYEQSLLRVYEGAIAKGRAMMPKYIQALGGRPQLDGQNKVITGEAGLAPHLVGASGETLNGVSLVQQNLQALTGADTAIIVKHDGGWIRAVTLLKDEKGVARIGSRLPDGDFLSQTLDAGREHAGLVRRNGRWYAMVIEPLKDAQGQMYGGLTVRVDVHDDVQRMLDAMLKSKVAEHGAIGVVARLPNGGWTYVGGPRAGQKATAQVEDFLSKSSEVSERGAMDYDLGPERGMTMISWVNIPNWNWVLYSSGPKAAFLEKSVIRIKWWKTQKGDIISYGLSG